MYRPAFTVVDDEQQARAMVTAARSGWLVTSTEDGPEATLLPILWRDSRVIAHMAKANPHWRTIGDGARALVIVTGPEAYVSPSWYPSKREHGQVVPTWNYLTVHLTGTVTVHRDPAWLLDAVTDLTDHHERTLETPWQVSDAPREFIDAQLKAIVGLEVNIERVEAKAKISQNRTEQDRLGVINGLRAATRPANDAMVEAMANDTAATSA